MYFHINKKVEIKNLNWMIMFIAKIFFEIRFLIIESGGRYLTIRLDLRQVFFWSGSSGRFSRREPNPFRNRI